MTRPPAGICNSAAMAASLLACVSLPAWCSWLNFLLNRHLRTQANDGTMI
jgi:hypothetical protein